MSTLQDLNDKKRTRQLVQLTRFFNENAVDISQCLHLSIDVQQKYLRVEERTKTAEHIGGTIAPAFNKLGIPTCWVYFAYDPKKADLGKSHYEYGGFHESVTPAPGDKFIRKTDMSAFKGSDIHSFLKKQGTKLLITTGFYIDQCVRATVLDAIKKDYAVLLLEDGTDSVFLDSTTKAHMAKAGVRFTDSGLALKMLGRVNI